MHYYGLGSLSAPIYVYIENTPPLPFYQNLDDIYGLKTNDVYQIGQETGNHWRKIFNVFAKLEFERFPRGFESWQALRDATLLQSKGEQCLLFNSPEFDQLADNKIHIIMGKTYASKLALTEHCYWLNEFFAYNQEKKLIICPYFDYRQLSNVKISQLVKLIEHVSG